MFFGKSRHTGVFVCLAVVCMNENLCGFGDIAYVQQAFYGCCMLVCLVGLVRLMTPTSFGWYGEVQGGDWGRLYGRGESRVHSKCLR